MQIIKIASVEVKNGEKDGKPWTKYTVIGEDKSSLSTFDRNAATLKSGDSIEAQVEVQGKYTNLKSFKVVGAGPVATQEKLVPGPQPPTAPSPVTPKDSRNTDEKIAEQVAVKAVVELAVGKVIEPNHPLVTAVKAWCCDKLRNYLSTIPPEAIKAPVVVSGKSEGDKDEGCGVDMTFLKELMGKLDWPPAKCASWLENRFPPMKRKGTLSDTINQLTQVQKAEFVKAISELAAGVK